VTNFTGTITGAASSTVAATTIRTQMQTTIPSNSAWSLVESTTMNAGAIPCDVYKCAAAQSGLSADFYIGVMQSGAQLAIAIAEGYNTSTHKPKRPAVLATSALQSLQSDGGVLPATQEIDWWNGSYNPGGGALSAIASNANSGSMAPATTDDYQIVVAKDMVLLYIRTAANILLAGAYETAVPTPGTNDPLPILQAKSQTSTFAGTFATRQPLSASASRGYACNCNGKAASDSTSSLYAASAPTDTGWANLGALGGAVGDSFDKYSVATGAQALKVPVLNSYAAVSATLGRDLNGWLRGYFKYIRYITGTSGFAVGDTCTVDGIGYTFGCNSSVNGLWFQTNPT